MLVQGCIFRKFENVVNIVFTVSWDCISIVCRETVSNNFSSLQGTRSEVLKFSKGALEYSTFSIKCKISMTKALQKKKKKLIELSMCCASCVLFPNSVT